MKLLLFCDGACRGNPGQAGAGAVLYDEQGAEVAAIHKFLGRATNNEAEYQGAILGLERAIALGARHVALRADSQLMVRQLTEHVPREKNARADALANEAIDRPAPP